MAGRKNWMAELAEMEGAVIDNGFDPYASGVRSSSPSLNFIFGKTHRIPAGYTCVFWGPPKGGKSLVCHDIIGQMHRDDPEGIAVKYDVELRERVQMTAASKRMFGIDPSRYIAYSVNQPDLIFDHFATDLAAKCEKGMPLRIVMIDSMNAIQGRRAMNATTVMTQQIGDNALTNKEGLKRILAVQRKYNITLLLTAHVGAELDTTEQMRGNKVRMAQAYGVQHHAEYFVYVERDKTKDAKTNMLGEKFEDTESKDMNDNADKTGQKHRVIMKDSSLGPSGRQGEFTFDYNKGIINQHEEVFVLGKNRGILGRPNNRIYTYGDKQWDGQGAMLEAVRNDPELAAAIIKEVRERDMKGMFSEQDKEDAIKAAALLGTD